MKRSEINQAQRAALALAQDHRFALPKWARWSLPDHRANPETSAFLTGRQIGWHVTDFGSGDFHRHGLTILSLRNGIFGDAAERPYTEKLLFIGEDQETPFHAHKVKIEDIIARNGGNLMVEFTAEGSFGSHFAPRLDGGLIDPFAGPIRLTPG
ncbi:MAG: D-lyxose/D-mannose family sugar isomerase, partial [Paracoccaceae bacterium]|nr:D-lyxose/D-mannose family sugar isomerase [Paracoccaceae bacterium]